MARQPIPRINGQYESYPKGIEQFVEKTADKLCEKYPNVDIIDLEFIFSRIFAHKMTMNMLRDNAKEV